MNNPSQIGKCSEKHRLCVLIRDALMLADELNCDVVAIHLNTALVKLTGEGVVPSEKVDSAVTAVRGISAESRASGAIE